MRLRPSTVAALLVVVLVPAMFLAAEGDGSAATTTVAASAVSALDDELLALAEYDEVEPLPEGDPSRGAEGAERSALALAEALGAVALPDEDGMAGEACPPERLEVLWDEPGVDFALGALARPLGPAPDEATEVVNGAVVCGGSDFAVMGFTARWALDRWIVLDVPAPDLGDHLEGDGLPLPDLAEVAVQPDDVDLTPLWTRRFPGPIEDYAPYAPQRVCDPAPKAGVVAFTELVRRAYPETRSYGISRACHLGGVSEHKEGRAWDWGVHADRPEERAAADAVVSWLMATDEAGNRHAMARRLGVMYVIWNRHIWSAPLADAGWRPYRGASPHVDHVHISFSPAGALGLTSFWRGVPLPQGLLGNPFEGVRSAFPPSFTAPPPRARSSEAGGERPEARDSWRPAPDHDAAAAEEGQAAPPRSGGSGSGGSSGDGSAGSGTGSGAPGAGGSGTGSPGSGGSGGAGGSVLPPVPSPTAPSVPLPPPPQAPLPLPSPSPVPLPPLPAPVPTPDVGQVTDGVTGLLP
jgi:hypothetical protein